MDPNLYIRKAPKPINRGPIPITELSEEQVKIITAAQDYVLNSRVELPVGYHPCATYEECMPPRLIWCNKNPCIDIEEGAVTNSLSLDKTAPFL